MARTTVRGRSGDVVTTLRVADRTGILAASAPPRAAESTPEPPSALLAVTQGERPAARRVRRNLLLACAAALFLVVGWIGGGVFAQRGGGDAPLMAVGAAVDREQGGTSNTPVPDQTAPVPAPAPPVVVPPAPVETKQGAEKAASSGSSGSSGSSASPKPKRVTGSAAPKPSEAPAVVERIDIPAKPAPIAMAEELRKMVESWSWSGPQPLAGR